MKKTCMTVYLLFMIGLCAFPTVALLWKRNEGSAENRELAAFPQIRTEDGWNTEFLPQLGEYYEDHFAYRQEMVTADAFLRSRVFGVSAADGVIVGTDGWLYYTDSLDDYLGSALLSDRSIFNIAHTLQMMQEYVEKSGRQFLFTVAPNKNSLYGEHMPYYDRVKIDSAHNIDKLKVLLQKNGVHYADLFALFEEQEEVLYHKRDSHWNNKGAALAAQTLFEALGKEYTPYAEADYTVRTDFEGDLDTMLCPLAVTAEEELYYEPFSYEYVEEVESNFDPEISTRQTQGEGGLLMYRDSFGNALLPFMAQEYEHARFSRGVPYYLDDMFFCNADTVIVERAERFLPDMAENPPVVQAPVREIDFRLLEGDAAEGAADCAVSDEGLFVKISGRIGEEWLDTESRIYIRLDWEDVYEAFPADIVRDNEKSSCGYTAYIEAARMPEGEPHIEIFTDTDGEIRKIYETKQEETGGLGL